MLALEFLAEVGEPIVILCIWGGEDCRNLSNEKIFRSFQVSWQEFIQRAPIDMTAELIERIVTANKITRLSSYVEAGCFNSHDRKQNMNKYAGEVYRDVFIFISQKKETEAS
ncbi:hypothetical protein M9H77_34846 [Catharanthus roseus]|uniref:Uncharacterized protein n=1 Tax=Catharanthus roseus TaxID=4058 RepID=A0ACB9ZNJ7_CATRO|nr:hypothetical protein M9H77_34846 [Catharanthus roseus]